MIEELRTRRAHRAEVAFAMACGAQLSSSDVPEPRARLAELCGVRGPTECLRTMDGLLAERGTGANDLAMELRWQATVVRTVPPDLAGWHRVIRQAAEHGQIGSHAVPLLLPAASRVSRWEDRFRANGLIPRHGVVHSLRAYDWGQAVTVAFLGRQAGYCDRATAERALLRAGELCARHYMSWADLSTAFALGRMVSLDDAGLDDADLDANYAEIRERRCVLLTDVSGPWRTTPWPPPAGRS
jgi:hypothetical protein